ncbi:MAG: hypothetical protein F4Y02_09120 [Chloroflexi bacterium]|nr:hypothetical protein [Chloroflexota bacterium]
MAELEVRIKDIQGVPVRVEVPGDTEHAVGLRIGPPTSTRNSYAQLTPAQAKAIARSLEIAAEMHDEADDESL